MMQLTLYDGTVTERETLRLSLDFYVAIRSMYLMQHRFMKQHEGDVIKAITLSWTQPLLFKGAMLHCVEYPLH